MDGRMPEGEVALRLAEYLLNLDGAEGHAEVAIDGASVRVHGKTIFDVDLFMHERGWIPNGVSKGKNTWTRPYRKNAMRLSIHSKSGVGDVVAKVGARRYVAECKKGPPDGKPGSPERPLLHAAIGQALTFDVDPTDIVVAAVPDTPAFEKIANEWRNRPLVTRSGIKIALVGRDGQVRGCPELCVSGPVHAVWDTQASKRSPNIMAN